MRTKLQGLRTSSGYSQAAFSRAVGISRSHYSQIETGEKDPSLKVSLRIKRALSYDNDDIFFNHRGPGTRR